MPLMERALQAAGVEVTVVTTDDNGPGEHLAVPIGVPVTQNGSTRLFFRKQTEFYKLSLPLARWLAHNVRTFDMVHVHALFSHASVAAARAAGRGNIPYVVRPLGVLNRYGMTRRRAGLKQLSFQTIEKPLLCRAAAMHYTSQQERIEAEETGVTTPSVIVPLGLDLEPFLSPCCADTFFNRFPAVRNRDIVLFLSRLDPKKGVDRLLDAFPKVKHQHPTVLLVVAGNGNEKTVTRLKKRAEQLRIADSVLWVGFLEGNVKRAALAAAKVFVLPSYSENFGIAVVEALACGVPSVVTPEVGISTDVQRSNAGLVVDGAPNTLSEAIVRLLKDKALARTVGWNARRLAQSRYSLESMGAGLTKLYEWALQNAKNTTHERQDFHINL